VKPLVEVEAYALTLEEDDELPGSVRERGKQIRELTSGSLGLLDTIQDYVGEGSHVREEVTLSSLVQSALERYRTELESKNIEVSFGLDSEGRVTLDPERMSRVISSLVRNAITAMPDGGNLSLRISDVDDKWVELSISDSGTSLDESALETAFEPFMSPSNREGTVLDLAVVRQIVENHGGTIALVTAEGEDTRLLVRLPRTPR
jgi:signal transduction histidine kinase